MRLPLTEELRVLATGVDSLYLSFRAQLAPELLDRLEELRTEAQEGGDPAPITFENGRAGAVEPHGSGRYRFWIRCGDFDVLISRSDKLPPVYAKLSSLCLHELGGENALATVEAFVLACLTVSSVPAECSRIDLYCDFQGWVPNPEDFADFVSRARRTTTHMRALDGHFSGRAFTGFQFGRDQVVARLYDKTREAAESGKSAWLPQVWGDRLDPAAPVWRLEFQFRREAIASFNLHGAREVLACRQDLWREGVRWLSLRVPTANQQRTRWPVDPRWRALSEVSIGSSPTGVLRHRIRLRDEARVVAGAVGYLSSLGAVLDVCSLDAALDELGRRGSEYLARRGRSFGQDVNRKRRLLF